MNQYRYLDNCETCGRRKYAPYEWGGCRRDHEEEKLRKKFITRTIVTYIREDGTRESYECTSVVPPPDSNH